MFLCFSLFFYNSPLNKTSNNNVSATPTFAPTPAPTENQKYKIKLEKPKHNVNKYKQQKILSLPDPTPTPSPMPTATPEPTQNHDLDILNNRPKRDENDIDFYDVPTPSQSFTATPFPTPSLTPAPTQTPRRTLTYEEMNQAVKTPIPLDDFSGYYDETQFGKLQTTGKSVPIDPSGRGGKEEDPKSKDFANNEDLFKGKNKTSNKVKLAVGVEEQKIQSNLFEIEEEQQADTKTCHRAAVFKNGKCVCTGGLIGDGIRRCEFPVPNILDIKPKSASGLRETKIIVNYKNSSFIPQGAFCLIGTTVVEGYIISESTVSCLVPPLGTGKKKICLSFDGKNCGESVIINFETAALSFIKLLIKFFIVIIACLVGIIVVYQKRKTFLRQARIENAHNSKNQKDNQNNANNQTPKKKGKKRVIVKKKPKVPTPPPDPDTETMLLVDTLPNPV